MTDKLIKFVSYDDGALEFFKPVPLSKVVPQWYKHIPNTVDFHDGEKLNPNIPTIKRCIPVLDYITSGYVLFNTYETVIRIEPDVHGINKASHVCPAEDYISGHPYDQCPVNMQNSKNHYFKVSNPWKVITPPGYSCHFYQPFFHLQEDYQMFPAIVDTDKHEDSVNFVGLALKKEFTIPAGEPLMVVYPFKRDDWKMEASYDDYRNKNAFKFFVKKMWHGTYSRLFHSRKKFR